MFDRFKRMIGRIQKPISQEQIVKKDNQVNKGLTEGIAELYDTPFNKTGKNPRGINVYTTTQIMQMKAKNIHGEFDSVGVENPYFLLAPEDRIRITQLCTPVLGVVTSRMNRIAGTKFIITNDKKEEDKIFMSLKNMNSVYKEFQKSDDISFIVARAKIYAELKTMLPDLLPDASNFNGCVLRWRKGIQNIKIDRCDEIWEWLQEPNQSDKWEDFIKKYVYDLMTHGLTAVYKEHLNGKVENIYILPGGTVIPIRDKYVTSKTGYVQLVSGEQPQLFYPDELSIAQYIPNSARSYGLVPMEALINKIAESMLFDKLSALGADHTRVPEKMIIINDSAPFGAFDGDLKQEVPISVAEQKRLEQKLNTPIQGGIMTFSGNNATVVDLSRENLMSYYNTRQRDIREDVALVYNMSNMEVNLTSSDGTSGRATSESQEEIDQGKGVVPILKLIENRFNRDVIPFRYGNGYRLNAQLTKSDEEELDLLTKKNNSGLYSVNELRINEMNEDPFDGDEFNKPRGAQSPDGSQTNPMYTQSADKG